MLIMFIPIVIFVLVLEYRRLMLTDPEPYIANGTFHLAHTSCGPVQGYPIHIFSKHHLAKTSNHNIVFHTGWQ